LTQLGKLRKYKESIEEHDLPCQAHFERKANPVADQLMEEKYKQI